MEPLDFKIVFEKPMATHFPGEEIIGQLVINLSSGEKKMVRIDVCFEGRGSVNWTEERSRGDDYTTESFSANETYFIYETFWNGKRFGGDPTLDHWYNTIAGEIGTLVGSFNKLRMVLKKYFSFVCQAPSVF